MHLLVERYAFNEWWSGFSKTESQDLSNDTNIASFTRQLFFSLHIFSPWISVDRGRIPLSEDSDRCPVKAMGWTRKITFNLMWVHMTISNTKLNCLNFHRSKITDGFKHRSDWLQHCCLHAFKSTQKWTISMRRKIGFKSSLNGLARRNQTSSYAVST
jgi:hypothetical protein